MKDLKYCKKCKKKISGYCTELAYSEYNPEGKKIISRKEIYCSKCAKNIIVPNLKKLKLLQKPKEYRGKKIGDRN